MAFDDSGDHLGTPTRYVPLGAPLREFTDPLIIARIQHAHDPDGTCVQNRFGTRRDCTALSIEEA